ncbi:MAG: hypothetical protein PVI01_19665 [Gemmatimonadales bacterium]|jgi:hypothetical protein
MHRSTSPIPDRLAAALADRYRFDQEIGIGGMATVYSAIRTLPLYDSGEAGGLLPT